MKKLYFFLVSLVILLSSCGKDPQPDPIKSFSVLGDSYSAYEGYVDPETNDAWTYYENIGVTEVEQMWWHQVMVEMGWTLERNNSFSGSLICNLNHDNYYGPHSYLRRMDDLGHPDAIFVFGGTNDIVDKAPLGDYVYADWTEEQLCMFRPGLASLLDGLKRLYPQAVFYLMIDMNLGSGGVEEPDREAFIESMHLIANHYQVKCIDLYSIHKDWWHPDAQGQADIARQVLEAVRGQV